MCNFVRVPFLMLVAMKRFIVALLVMMLGGVGLSSILAQEVVEKEGKISYRFKIANRIVPDETVINIALWL